MPYARLLYHVVWATKNRTPSIPDAMVDVIREAISETSRGLDVAIFAVAPFEFDLEDVVGPRPVPH